MCYNCRVDYRAQWREKRRRERRLRLLVPIAVLAMGVAGALTLPHERPRATLKWESAPVRSVGPPHLASSGDVLVVARPDGAFLGLDAATGAARWPEERFVPLGGRTVAVGAGRAFVAGGDGAVRAFWQSDGRPAWSEPLSVAEGVSAPLLYADDTLYVASEAGAVIAAKAETGEVIWRNDEGAAPVVAGMAFGDGRLYVAALDGKARALSAENGQVAWKAPSRDSRRESFGMVYSDLVLTDGALSFGSDDGWVYVLASEDGVLRSAFRARAPVRSRAAVEAGAAYFASCDGVFRKVGLHGGEAVWEYASGVPATCPPALVGRFVCFGADDGRVYGLDKLTGECEWTWRCGAAIKSLLAVGGDAVVCATWDGSLHALRTPR
ncbi:MAG: PQQ-binding-like beta-propeller repeat protein [Armatimonadota bacterium]